jgi:hypothetical protein
VNCILELNKINFLGMNNNYLIIVYFSLFLPFQFLEAQTLYNGEIKDTTLKRELQGIEGVTVINLNENIYKVSQRGGKFDITCKSEKPRLLFLKKNYIPIVTNTKPQEDYFYIDLQGRSDYFPKNMNDTKPSPDYDEIEISGKIEIASKYKEFLINCNVYISNLPYISRLNTNNQFTFPLSPMDISRLKINKSVFLIIYKHDTFIKTIELKTNSLNNIFDTTVYINPAKDFIGSGRISYNVITNDSVTNQITIDELEEKNQQLTERVIHLENPNSESPSDSTMLLQTIEYKAVVDSLIEFLEIKHKPLDSTSVKQQYIVEDSVFEQYRFAFDTLYQTLSYYQNAQDYTSMHQNNKNDHSSHRETSNGIQRSFSEVDPKSFYKSSRITFIPNKLLYNNDINNNINSLYMLGLESNLDFKSKKKPKQDTDFSPSIFLKLFFLQTENEKVSPEWYIGIIPGKMKLLKSLSIQTEIGFGNGIIYYENPIQRSNTMMINFSASIEIFKTGAIQIDLFSILINKISIENPKFGKSRTTWGIVGLGLSF